MAALNVLGHNLNTPNSSGLAVKMKTSNTTNVSAASTPTTITTATIQTTPGGGGAGGGGGGGAAVGKQQFSKITVQNVLSENNGNLLNISNNLNGNNTIVRKIKDFGMFGTVNASTGNASNRSASSLTAASTARKRAVSTSENKDKSGSSSSEAKPGGGVGKKAKANKESKKESAKANGSATKLSAKERAADKVCTPKVKSVADGTKVPGTPGRKGLPLPLAVARRNARERNRVKQVNNGFAALRERIPEEVAETFESQVSSRGSAKKLSKVETLRMAVEYIRSLERLLGFDFPIPGDMDDGNLSLLPGASCDEDNFTLIKDEFDALSPSMDDQFDDSLSNYDMDDYFNSNGISPNGAFESNGVSNAAPNVNQNDMLPNITTLNGLQYIRIPGTNTYQLLTPDIFIGNSNSPPNSSAEEDQFNGIIDANCLSPSAGESSAADLHVSPPLIMGTSTRSPAAMATLAAECASSSSLSRSPVPQATSPLSASSPNANTTAFMTTNMLHLASAQPAATTLPAMHTTSALSPAANELLLRTCAITATSPAAITDALNSLNAGGRSFVAPTLPHIDLLQQPRMIKQEYNEADFTSPTTAASSIATTALIYHQTQSESQQQHLLHDHTTAVSQPLDQNNVKCMSTAMPLQLPNIVPGVVGLQAFYEHEQNGNFYESVVTYKKELSDSLLETSSNCHSGNTPTLSDESMIDTIDWWEAHTPKSDGGSVIL